MHRFFLSVTPFILHSSLTCALRPIIYTIASRVLRYLVQYVCCTCTRTVRSTFRIQRRYYRYIYYTVVTCYLVQYTFSLSTGSQEYRFLLQLGQFLENAWLRDWSEGPVVPVTGTHRVNYRYRCDLPGCRKKTHRLFPLA